MHAILPFLCLGIGIDDMFVITQCWNNLASKPGLSKEAFTVCWMFKARMKHREAA